MLKTLEIAELELQEVFVHLGIFDAADSSSWTKAFRPHSSASCPSRGDKHAGLYIDDIQCRKYQVSPLVKPVAGEE